MISIHYKYGYTAKGNRGKHKFKTNLLDYNKVFQCNILKLKFQIANFQIEKLNVL